MIANLLLLTGEDDFRLIQRRNFYRDAFRGKFEDGEIETFEVSDTFRSLENAVMTPNLFGTKRLIFTDEFWGPDNFEKAVKSQFFDLVEKQAEQCTIISLERSPDKRTKSAKFLLKQAKVEEFKRLEETSLYEWMINFSAQFAAVRNPNLSNPLSYDVARKLVARCGEDGWNLSREMEKLITYSDGQPITDHMIVEITVPHPKAIIWDFLSELSKKNVQGAMHTFRELITMGESVHQIFSMVVREIRIHAMIRSGIDQGMDPKSIAGASKLHPFVVQKTLPLSRQFTTAQIKDLYDQLYEIDTRLKTGGILTTSDDTGEFELAIEKLIVGMGK